MAKAKAGAGAQGMFYAQAVKSGIQTAHLMLGGDTAETIAAYNNEYARVAAQGAAQDALTAAQKNISVTKQNVILSNIQLQMQQDQAEAAVKVSAAVSGVEGTNVQNATYQTKANESYAGAAVQAKGDAQIDAYLAQAHNATLQLASTANAKQDINYGAQVVGDLMSSFNMKDLQNVGTYMEENDWFGEDTMDYADGSGMGFGERQT